jgi:hypothetical protein
MLRAMSLLALRHRHLAALHQLDQVHAEARHHGWLISPGSAVHHLLELGHELARVDPAQVAALLGAAVLRMLARQVGERAPSTMRWR